MNNYHLVIMAGGIGSRFWPMSTPECPKQFVDVLGCGRTFIQMTVDRFAGIVSPENIWVVTSAQYRDTVARQLPEIPAVNILLEPCRRNTAPCIAYAAWRIKSVDPKAVMVVSPSDHLVLNVMEFQRVIKSCLEFAGESDSIVTLGMKPTRPETGYGYIQTDMSCPSVRNREIFRVDKFREKPDLQTAEKYPIQIQLRSIILQSSAIVDNMANDFDMYGTPPDKAVKMACTVIATVPILCVYPFVQKYFTKGVMVGAVKG